MENGGSYIETLFYDDIMADQYSVSLNMQNTTELYARCYNSLTQHMGKEKAGVKFWYYDMMNNDDYRKVNFTKFCNCNEYSFYTFRMVVNSLFFYSSSI